MKTGIKILSFLLFFTQYIFAQDTEVIRLGGNSSKTDEKRKKGIGLVVKTDLLSFVFGSQELTFEKSVTDFLSLELGTGLTFNPILNINKINEENTDKYNKGLSLHFGPRFYFSDEVLDSWYLSPTFGYRTSSYTNSKEYYNELTNIVEIYDSKTNVKEKRLMLRSGNQTIYNNNLTLDYFVSLGVRMFDYTQNTINGFDAQGKPIIENTKNKGNVLGYEIGLRLGWHFE